MDIKWILLYYLETRQNRWAEEKGENEGWQNTSTKRDERAGAIFEHNLIYLLILGVQGEIQ